MLTKDTLHTAYMNQSSNRSVVTLNHIISIFVLYGHVRPACVWIFILLFIYYFIYLLLINLAYELALLEALFNYIFINI